MKHTRYSVESSDGHVKFEGSLLIEEAMKFMEFFKSVGYTQITTCDDGDTLYLSKGDAEYTVSELKDAERSIEYQRGQIGLMCARVAELESNQDKVLKEECIQLRELLDYERKKSQAIDVSRRVADRENDHLKQEIERVKRQYIKDLGEKNGL
jgi:hypothetical protein